MKYWIFIIMMIALIGTAAAETCYTAISVPQAQKYYWKAITYTGIQDGNYADYFTKTDSIGIPTGIGAGYQYTIRIDKDCFDHNLLSNIYATGITSDQINIQKKYADYYTQNYIPNKLYTISIPADTESVSTKLVSQVSTGFIESVDYLAIPGSFSETGTGAHPEVQALLDKGLCDRNLKITSQLDKIKLALWDKTQPVSTTLSCSEQSIIDCVLKQGKATNKDMTASVMILARKCGVPTRVAYGISEGQFDGVDLTFDNGKQHYWIEYYDGKWYNLEVTEGGTSIPTGKETNCQDGTDNDNNAMTDCFDPACTIDAVCNNWFTTTMYKNSYSTDLSKLPNPYNVNNLTLGNEFGSITWTEQHIDLRGLQLESAVSIGPNQLRISDTATTLNKTGTGVLKKLVATPIQVLRNEQNCTQCVIKNTLNNSATFVVPGTGIYTLVFPPPPNTTITPAEPPKTDTGITTKIWNKIKEIWNKTTTTTKIVAGVIILGLWWLWRRRRNRMNYYRR